MQVGKISAMGAATYVVCALVCFRFNAVMYVRAEPAVVSLTAVRFRLVAIQPDGRSGVMGEEGGGDA